MPKSKKTKAVKYGLATAMIGQAVIPVATVLAEEQQQIDLEIAQQKDVDVVLTLGSSNVVATNFDADLIRELQERGVDPSRVNVQAITTQDQNIQTEFNWNQDVYSHIGSINIQNNGSKIQMYGNRTNAGFNKIYTDNNKDPNIKEQELGFSFTLDYGDSFDGAGVLLNTHVENGKMNGYALFFPENRAAELYKLTNWTSDSNQDIRKSSNSQRIATIPLGNSGSFKLKTTKDSLTIFKNGSKVGTYNLPEHFGWGFGFFSDHYSHNCNLIGQFSLNNIQLTKTYAEDFSELIRTPEWRDNTERFIVNLEDNKLPDFDSPSASGEILTRLMNENIHYVGLGTNTNKAQALDFIARNSGNGTFVDNTNYAQAIDEIADYIVAELNKNVKTVTAEDPYIVIDSPISINVTPEELKSNTETPEYPNGRWRLEHNPDYFENGEGLSSLATGFRSSLPTSFDKPGEYEIFFEDTHPNPQFVYVHRKPVADFSMTINKTAEGVTVTTVDNSYDPDHQSEENKGIVERKWRWKETTATTWNEGQLPANLPEGKKYLLQLQVKDVEGEWSLPVTTYVTTDKSVQTTPIANFTVSDSTLVIDKELGINDSSYDPAGTTLTQKQWKVFKDDNFETPIYTGSTPVTDFSTYGSGKYTIELSVTNENGKQSDPFSRTIKVVEQEYIDALGNIDEMHKNLSEINTEEGLKNLKEIAEQTQELIDGLQEGPDKEHAKAEFEKVNKNIEGTEKVNTLEEKSKKLYTSQAIEEAQALYNDVFTIVDSLPEGTIKDGLNQRLENIKEAIENAESLLINVELINNNQDVLLTWLPYEGAESYRVLVYQFNEETGEYERFGFARAAHEGESLEITGLVGGHNYLFEVYPRINGVVASDGPNGSVAIDVPEPEVESVPVVQNVTATAKGTDATVTWDALEGATRYRVQAYVKDPVTGEFVRDGFGRTTSNNMIDMKFLEEGKTYKFEVIPSIDGSYSEESKGTSNEVVIEVVEETDPVVESKLNVTIDGTTAHLSWDTIEDATRYRVQVYVKDESGIFVKDGYAKSVNDTEYTIEGLKEGTEYKFEVTPRIGYVFDSEYLISATAETAAPTTEPEVEEPTEPSANGNVFVSLEGTTAHLSWDTIEDATRYRVQRYILNEETGKFEKDSYARTVNGTEISLSGLKEEMTYKFQIVPQLGFYDESKSVTTDTIQVPASAE